MNRVCLNGPWQIRHDPFNAGLLWNWHSRPPEDGWREIAVPCAWQSVLGMDANGVAWYRRELPRELIEWAGDERSRIRLRFESVATDCRAWVNGLEVGRHAGDYVPFEFDVTDAVRAAVTGSGGRGTPPALVLRVDQVHAPRPVKGTVTENGHITKGFHDVLSAQHAGVWGGVSVRRTGINGAIPSGVSVHADPLTGRALVRVGLIPTGVAPVLPCTIHDSAGSLLGGGMFEGRPGDTSAEIEVRPDAPVSAWSPHSPTLYTLKLSVGDAGGGRDGPVDFHTLRFGYRTTQTGGPDNRHILLNKTPLLLRGILHWGHEPRHIAPAPPPEQVREEFTRLRALGFNCVCLCMVYMPEYFYDIADETGMLIWQEHPLWKSRTGAELHAEYQRLFEAFMCRDARHPSVILVSGSCEHEAFDKTLAQWWWKRAKELIPDKLLQVQTAFLEWTDPDQADLYDEHVYDNTGRWAHFLDDVEETIKGVKPKPFVMGETILSNAWPNVGAYRSRLGTNRPWWETRGLRECAEFESRLAAWATPGTVDRFRTDADRFSKQFRKFQAEMFRAHRGNAGWVMNHIRDVPGGRCGFKDDFEEWRYSPRETLPWLADTALILRTPDWLRSFAGGSRVGTEILLSHFGTGPAAGEIAVTAIAGDDARFEHRAHVSAAPGDIAAIAFELPLPTTERPTPITVCATGPCAHPNEWTLWALPTRTQVPPGVFRMAGLPFTDAERVAEFEERGYSAGWGLRCRSWRPILPDTAALLPTAPAWEHDAPMSPDARVIVTHRLTARAAPFLEGGGRIVLLASRHAGGFGSKFVNYYGHVPLVIDDVRHAWPLDPGDSGWVVDLLHHDLSRFSARAVPVQDLGIDGRVSPIVRLVFTHDGGAPRLFDALFTARVGDGLLIVSCLDHSTAAGRHLLDRLVGYAATARELPAPDLDIAGWLI